MLGALLEIDAATLLPFTWGYEALPRAEKDLGCQLTSVQEAAQG